MGWVEYILIKWQGAPKSSRDDSRQRWCLRQRWPVLISPKIVMRRNSRDPDSLTGRQEGGQVNQEEHQERRGGVYL